MGSKLAKEALSDFAAEFALQYRHTWPLLFWEPGLDVQFRPKKSLLSSTLLQFSNENLGI